MREYLQEVRRAGDLHHGVCALNARVARDAGGARERHLERKRRIILRPRELRRERHFLLSAPSSPSLQPTDKASQYVKRRYIRSFVEQRVPRAANSFLHDRRAFFLFGLM